MQLAVLQRCGTVPSETCACHVARKTLMRSGLRRAPSFAPPVVHEVLTNPGARLETNVRLAMQARLGRDFSQVRVHTGSRADDAAASVTARAFTVGSDVVFGRGQYAPDTAVGASLLTHELTHVMQQQGGDSRPSNLVVGPAGSRQEQEAERLADITPSASTRTAAALVQRQVLSDVEIDEMTQAVPDPDLAVRDGSSPVAGAEPAGEVADAGLSSERYLAETDGDEFGAVYLARSPAGKPQASPKKKPSKAKARLITDINVDLGAQELTLTWSDGASESHTVSTGIGCPNTSANPCPTGKEAYCTPTGDFTAGDKGDESKTNSHGDKMAWWVRVVGGIGIHNSQKADGTPRSHGCIRVGDGAADEAYAKKINQHVTGHTKVHISGTAPTKPWHLSAKNMEKFHFDGCPAPALAKPAPTSTKRTPPGRVRHP
jgi:lipoprotein-anchoring transpeptidase ErfK/SrfK